MDKLDCFARIDSHTCNALNKKKCDGCKFYKNKQDVPGYEIYLKKGIKELKNKKKD